MAETCVLQQHFPSLAAFRSSEALRTAARSLLNHALLLPVKRRVHNSYEMGARVEALLDFIVAACCIPHVFALLGEGSVTSNKQQQQQQTSKSSYETSQAMLQECLQYFKDAHQEYLAQGATDESLDEQRTRLVVEVLNYRRVPWVVSFARTVETHLPPLLGTMARHLLVVVNLCDEVTRKINAVTLTVRRKVASSSNQDEEGAKQDPLEVLAFHVAAFWTWLRENRVRLVPLCRVTELVTSLDPVLRNSLKQEHYTSPEQFLEVFNNRYRSTLSQLSVPLLEWTHTDYEQAMKDVNREHVIVNERRIPGSELQQQLSDVLQPLVHTYLCTLCDHYATTHGGNSAGNANTEATTNDRPSSRSGVPSDLMAKEASDLTRRIVDHVIVASARTIACGDMLLLLQDLFGGEGLVLTPHGKDPIDVHIQVSDGDIVMEAVERFHLVEADQPSLRDKQQMDILMTFRMNAITRVKLSRCPRCKADLNVRASPNDEAVETKAERAAEPPIADDTKVDQDMSSTTKAVSGQKKALQQACLDVFDRLSVLSQRHMWVLPLLPVAAAAQDFPRSQDENLILADDDDDAYDV